MEIWQPAVGGAVLAIVVALVRTIVRRCRRVGATFHVDGDVEDEMREEEEEREGDEEETEARFKIGDLVEHRATCQRGVVMDALWDGDEWVYDLDVGFDQSTLDEQPEIILILAADQRLSPPPA